MNIPKPSLKQSIIFIILIVLVVVGSGFITNRKKSFESDISKNDLDKLNKNRLRKADNHLQTIVQPIDVKKELNND